MDHIDRRAVDLEAYVCAGAGDDRKPDLDVLKLAIGNCLRFIVNNLEAAANNQW